MQLSQQNQELTEKLKTRKRNHTSHVCLSQLFSTSCRRGSVQKSQRFSSPEPQTEEFCFALQRRNVWKITRDASLSLRWVGEPVSFGKLLFEEGRKHTREHFLLRRLKGRSWRMNAAAVSHPPSERLVLNASPESRSAFHFKFVQQQLRNFGFVSSFLFVFFLYWL